MSEQTAKSKTQAELRERAEAALRQQPIAASNASVDANDRLIHELRTRQIELEVQNEELRRAHAELAESRDDYADLYDFAPVGYVTVSDRDLILKANLTLIDWLGRDRQSVVNKRLSAFVVDEDQDVFYTFCRTVLEGQQTRSCQLRMHRVGADPFWAQLDGAVVETTGDREFYLRLAITDITEQKQAQSASLKSQQQLDAFFTESPAGLAIVHGQLHCVKINQTLARFNGSTVAEYSRRTKQPSASEFRGIPG
ncbi:MAG TPA: PAS domain S-box protein [Planctomycetes bacterium]|nr:PAS domain S-box protein [Fuerstiella sp.]HIK92892.1 PAS domain S-box protein [Planctomycetota bacterium]